MKRISKGPLLLSCESKIKSNELLNKASGGGEQEVDQALGLTVSQRDQDSHKISRGPPSTSHSSHSTAWISVDKQCMQVAETRLRLPEFFFPLDTRIHSLFQAHLQLGEAIILCLAKEMVFTSFRHMSKQPS